MVGGIVDGKYRLLRLLGQGGMGTVFEAERLQAGTEGAETATQGRVGAAVPGTRVALKLIKQDLLAEHDSSGLARFRREARAASAAHAEHIVRALDFGTDAATGAPYMVMELLDGEDLEQVLSAVGMLRPDTVLRIGAQVCLGLQKAHEARIIHRDIKPANIFLARRAGGHLTVKILDFGIAKIKPGPGDQTSGLTRSGGLLGSPRYMSPEQGRGARDTDFRTDLWSLGLVLYQALSGTPPYHDARNLGDLIVAICTSPPRLLQELAPWVPPEVVSIIHTALRLDPDERYPSAAHMLDAIQRLLPSGWDLDEGQLLAPGEETRGHVAPRPSWAGKNTEAQQETVRIPQDPATNPCTTTEFLDASAQAGRSQELPDSHPPPTVEAPPPQPLPATLAGSLWARLLGKGSR